MRKIILYIACSLNGKIAREDGSIDWLEKIPNPDNSDYGYQAFLESIDTTIMGNNTYKQLIGWDIEFPYKDTTNYVLSIKTPDEPSKFATFIPGDPIAFIKELKKQPGKDIWLIGGGKVNSLLWNARLIDEIKLFVMPVLLSDGIDVFEGFPKENELKLLDSHRYESGVVELNYKASFNDG